MTTTIANTVGDLRALLASQSNDTPLAGSYTGEGRLRVIVSELGDQGFFLAVHVIDEPWLTAHGLPTENPLITAMYQRFEAASTLPTRIGSMIRATVRYDEFEQDGGVELIRVAGGRQPWYDAASDQRLRDDQIDTFEVVTRPGHQ